MGALLSFLFTVRDVPKLFFAPDIATVTVRKSNKEEDLREISLRDLVEERCPSLHNTFLPAWWLPNGHAQTAYCVVGDFSRVDKVEYERTLIRIADSGTLGLDITPSPSAPYLRDDTPIIVVTHGLTGGSYESYVRAILAPACAAPEQGGLGYRAVVVNFRGCAGVPVTSPQLYSAGQTDDLRTAILHISQRWPNAPLLGVGFSLGANVLTRYLAEEGDRSRLISGCAIGCPWDLLANSKQLEGTWWRRQVYSTALGGNLKALLQHHIAAFEASPSKKLNEEMHRVFKESKTTLYDFDNSVTRLIGGPSPPFPFARAEDYYIWASSHHVLGDIRVPHLCLNANDDPIVTVLPVQEGQDALGPWIVFGTTKKGGHLGWFEQGSSADHPHRWFHRPVLEWLKTMGDEFVAPKREYPGVEEVDGLIAEVGNHAIAYRVLESTGHIVGVEGEEGLLKGF